MHYCIIGFGGIGKALATELKSNNTLTIVSRKDLSSLDYKSYQIDVTQPESSHSLMELFKANPPDRVINTVGILHDAMHRPEKSLKEIEADWFIESLRINTLPTIHIAKALASTLTHQSACRFLVLSARVGSIGDNRLGGWTSYRVSKSALNMLVRNISIEWRQRFPKSLIIGYHPGTVDTPLSEPFQKNVPADKLFSCKQAAAYLIDVMENRKPQDSGHCFDWQGMRVPA